MIKVFYSIIGILIPLIGLSQQVILDNCFDEWIEYEQFNDTSTNDGNLDLLNMSYIDINDRLYFKLETSQEFKFTEFDFANKGIILYLDSDNDQNTGTPVNGIGADILMDFGSRYFRVFYPGVASFERNLNDINFLISPTTTGTIFEFSIDMDYTPFNNLRPFNGGFIRFQFESSSGDLLPETPQSYTLKKLNADYPFKNLEKEKSHYLRLMTYNTLNEGLDDPDRINHFKSITQAIDPDIITFNESDVSENYVEIILEDWLGETWYASGSSNSRNITASKYPITESFPLSSRMIACMIDLPNDQFNTDFLSINLHAQCCENDFERQIEADRFISFIKDVKRGEYPSIPELTPFVISGDFNFVGDMQQLITVLNGDIVNNNDFGADELPDWDNSSLQNAKCLNLSSPNNFSWYNSNSSFTPGKLDFIIYSNSTMAIEKSFALKTDELNQGLLIDNNLQTNDTNQASDHLPLVADFKLFHSVSVNLTQNLLTEIKFDSYDSTLLINNHGQKRTISVINYNGTSLANNTIPSGQSSINLNRITSGLYFVLDEKTGEILFHFFVN